MKALIRKPGETVFEYNDIPGIDWDTGAPLTNPEWCGGPYILVNDYVQEVPAEDPEEHVEDFENTQPVLSTPSAEQVSRSSESEGAVTEPLPETVSYGGKEYTLEELKKLIG